MKELWQLYNEDGAALDGQGATKDEVFGKGLLHGAAHVWIWRNNKGATEVLLQKRGATKRTWPNKLDISAAGHIDLGETPLEAAVRETSEEIGLVIKPSDLTFVTTHRAHLNAGDDNIENEFQWLYIFQLPLQTDFTLADGEVDSVIWVSLDAFETECNSDRYVPHGAAYYKTVVTALKNIAT